MIDLQARLQPLLEEDHEDAAEAEEEEAGQAEAEDQGEDGEAEKGPQEEAGARGEARTETGMLFGVDFNDMATRGDPLPPVLASAAIRLGSSSACWPIILLATAQAEQGREHPELMATDSNRVGPGSTNR